MSYLLDTCLLSEVWKPAPNAGVMAWLSTSREEELHLSVLSLGEIKKGIGKLVEGKRKLGFVRDYALLRGRFGQRILPVTDSIAERWGEIAARGARQGRVVHVVDGLLAATALELGLTVVTRNTSDFEPTGAPVLCPWR